MQICFGYGGHLKRVSQWSLQGSRGYSDRRRNGHRTGHSSGTSVPRSERTCHKVGAIMHLSRYTTMFTTKRTKRWSLRYFAIPVIICHTVLFYRKFRAFCILSFWFCFIVFIIKSDDYHVVSCQGRELMSARTTFNKRKHWNNTSRSKGFGNDGYIFTYKKPVT